MKYKLLVIDIDGTLVDKEGIISVDDGRALVKAAASGVKVVLSTGRVIKACEGIINRFCLDGHHIFFDGALVSDLAQSQEIYSQPINKEVVRQAIEFARCNDIYLELYSKDRFFAERENWSDDIHYKFFGVRPVIVNFDDIWEQERIMKAELLVHNPEEKKKAELFHDKFNSVIRFSTAHSPAFTEIDFINILDPKVSKGEALKELTLFMGISTNEVIAIGDGLNDIPLLETAGLAVAMGNALPKVKEIADYITLGIDSNGVAATVEKFII